MYTDSTDKADILNNHFSSVFTEEDLDSLLTIHGSHTPDISTSDINPIGVQKLLEDLDIHKASGPDNTPSRLLKETASLMAPLLTLIFQASIQQGTVPDEWKKANVVPIDKKGSRSDPGNYRPVSLTSICCKTLEHIIYSFIFTHLNKYNILCDNQHGFRSKRSCETQLLGAVNDFAKALNSGEQIDALFLDFSKAFDKVPHERLCHKLSHYGINGHLLDWIKSFLTDRTQSVVIDGENSCPSTVLSGVPQGTVLAPLLFLIFINDITQDLQCTVRLYADDILIYNIIHFPNDSEHLQQDLCTLQAWARRWQMEFNPAKCVHLTISNKHHIIEHNYYLFDHLIQKVSKAKYLGITFDEHLTWKNHIHNICHKANSALAFMRRNVNHCPISVRSHCYKSLVRPILEYASPIWAPHLQSDICAIEKIQSSATRYTMNNYSWRSSVTNMLTSLNWPSLES